MRLDEGEVVAKTTYGRLTDAVSVPRMRWTGALASKDFQESAGSIGSASTAAASIISCNSSLKFQRQTSTDQICVKISGQEGGLKEQ